MSTFDTILLLAFLAREVHFNYVVNKLLDKAMSRSFHEYQIAKNQDSDMGKSRHIPYVNEDDSEAEDLGVLQGLI